MYLCDSGGNYNNSIPMSSPTHSSQGQYLDGTTDVTRTWVQFQHLSQLLFFIQYFQHFGTPTDEEKRAFTRVLQGHIAIDVAVVPNGTTGELTCSLTPLLAFNTSS
jgi:Xaa-Pro aminopeptidase